MNNFALEIWDNECTKCTFYTVRWIDAVTNETDKFFNKYYAIEKYKQPTQILLSFIVDSIGNDYGATDQLFNRFENEVSGLPNKGKTRIDELTFHFPNFPLRLYALRIGEDNDIVIIFNGGVKSAETNQESKELHIKWTEACRFAKVINLAMQSGEITINKNRTLLYYNGDIEIHL